MRTMLFALAMAFSGQSIAGFIPYSDTTDRTYGFEDDDSGIEWLSLELTFGLSVTQALNQYKGYELASFQQVLSLYNKIFTDPSLSTIDSTTPNATDSVIKDENGVDVVQRHVCLLSELCFSQTVTWHNLFAPNLFGGANHSEFVWGTVFNASGNTRLIGVRLRNANQITGNTGYIYTEHFREDSKNNTFKAIQGVGTYLVKQQDAVEPTRFVQAALTSATSVSEPSQSLLLCLGLAGIALRQRAKKQHG